MTTVVDALRTLDSAGLYLAAEGGRLRCWPKGRLTPELLALLRAHKPELLRMRQPATVANAKTLPAGWQSDPTNTYIGRAAPRLRLPASPFANRFRIGPDGDRAEVIRKYRRWLCGEPELMRRALTELPGKRLICWCTPAACHGDVLVELLNYFCKEQP